MSKARTSTRTAVRKVVKSALESASSASVISELIEARKWPGPLTIQPSVITLRTRTGPQLRIITLTGNSSSRAELVSKGRTIDAAPTGTYVLVGGKTLAVDKGRLVPGTSAVAGNPDWAVFALLPADRGRFRE